MFWLQLGQDLGDERDTGTRGAWSEHNVTADPQLTYLEEAGDGGGSTLVSVHPGHEPTSLDVGSTGVVGDALKQEVNTY